MKNKIKLTLHKVIGKRAGDTFDVPQQSMREIIDEQFRQIHHEIFTEKNEFNKINFGIFIPQGTKKIIFVRSEKERKRMDRKIHKRGKHANHFVMIANVPTAIHSVIGTIKATKKFATQKKRYSDIIAGCTDNDWITISAGTITLVGDFYTTFETSTTDGRKDALRNLNDAVKDNLLAPFQKGANLDPANAADILSSGNFYISLVNPRQKQVLGVKNSKVKGKLAITGPVQGKNTAHDWWYTLDNGKTAVRMDPTISSKTFLAGMVSGSSVGIAHQTITRKGPQGISAFVYITVS